MTLRLTALVDAIRAASRLGVSDMSSERQNGHLAPRIDLMASISDPPQLTPQALSLHPVSGDALSSMIATRILPQVCNPGFDGSYDNAGNHIPASEVDGFVASVRTHRAEDLLAIVERYLASGISVETVCLELLTPAARQLGVFWEEDTYDFTDVTMAMARLQELLRDIGLRTPSQIVPFSRPYTALFAPIPGDQHSFGATMIHEFFVRAGWQAELMVEPTLAKIGRMLERHSFDLVGLTVSNDCSTRNIAEVISAIRATSRNAEIRCIVGGRAIDEAPDIASKAGADGTASDANSALELADRLVTESNNVAVAPA